MSENDPRFGYPIEFVKEHVLGCFEASKACALLPGKPHLYHVEFLKREDSTEIKNGSELPLDFFLKAHFSPCEEVSWYLHTRKDFATYEGSEQADEKYVTEHEQGVVGPTTQFLDKAFKDRLVEYYNSKAGIAPLQPIPELTEKEKATYMFDALQAHSEKLTEVAAAATRSISVPTTPENSQDSQTVTIDPEQGYYGCLGCRFVNRNHSRACKARRSRFDKISKELGCT